MNRLGAGPCISTDERRRLFAAARLLPLFAGEPMIARAEATCFRVCSDW